MFSRARWRLTLWFAASFAVILLLICGAVYVAARSSLMAQVNDDLEVRSDRFLRSYGNRPVSLVELQQVLRFSTAGGYVYVLIGPGGNVFPPESAEQVTMPDVDDLRAETADGPAFVSAETSDGEELRLLVRPLREPGGSPILLIAGRSIEPELQALRRLLFILLGGGAVGLALAAAGGFWLAGRALHPIQTTMDAQRQFVADASHELRTPLSLIRANAEIMKRQAGPSADTTSVDDIISETDRLSYLVGQMLTLARAESNETAAADTRPVDVSRLASDIARQMEVLAAEKNITMNVQTNGAAVVTGDEQRLGELMLILLDNSIKYSDSGGAVSVDVKDGSGRVTIAVADTGRGIPPSALPHVFDRFYRVDKARAREMGGTGLGLAIARWIAESHGGTIDIQSEVGTGTRVTVELPAAG